MESEPELEPKELTLEDAIRAMEVAQEHTQGFEDALKDIVEQLYLVGGPHGPVTNVHALHILREHCVRVMLLPAQVLALASPDLGPTFDWLEPSNMNAERVEMFASALFDVYLSMSKGKRWENGITLDNLQKSSQLLFKGILTDDLTEAKPDIPGSRLMVANINTIPIGNGALLRELCGENEAYATVDYRARAGLSGFSACCLAVVSTLGDNELKRTHGNYNHGNSAMKVLSWAELERRNKSRPAPLTEFSVEKVFRPFRQIAEDALYEALHPRFLLTVFALLHYVVRDISISALLDMADAFIDCVRRLPGGVPFNEKAADADDTYEPNTAVSLQFGRVRWQFMRAGNWIRYNADRVDMQESSDALIDTLFDSSKSAREWDGSSGILLDAHAGLTKELILTRSVETCEQEMVQLRMEIAHVLLLDEKSMRDESVRTWINDACARVRDLEAVARLQYAPFFWDCVRLGHFAWMLQDCSEGNTWSENMVSLICEENVYLTNNLLVPSGPSDQYKNIIAFCAACQGSESGIEVGPSLAVLHAWAECAERNQTRESMGAASAPLFEEEPALSAHTAYVINFIACAISEYQSTCPRAAVRSAECQKLFAPMLQYPNRRRAHSVHKRASINAENIRLLSLIISTVRFMSENNNQIEELLIAAFDAYQKMYERNMRSVMVGLLAAEQTRLSNQETSIYEPWSPSTAEEGLFTLAVIQDDALLAYNLAYALSFAALSSFSGEQPSKLQMCGPILAKLASDVTYLCYNMFSIRDKQPKRVSMHAPHEDVEQYLVSLSEQITTKHALQDTGSSVQHMEELEQEHGIRTDQPGAPEKDCSLVLLTIGGLCLLPFEETINVFGCVDVQAAENNPDLPDTSPVPPVPKRIMRDGMRLIPRAVTFSIPHIEAFRERDNLSLDGLVNTLSSSPAASHNGYENALREFKRILTDMADNSSTQSVHVEVQRSFGQHLDMATLQWIRRLKSEHIQKPDAFSGAVWAPTLTINESNKSLQGHGHPIGNGANIIAAYVMRVNYSIVQDAINAMYIPKGEKGEACLRAVVDLAAEGLRRACLNLPAINAPRPKQSHRPLVRFISLAGQIPSYQDIMREGPSVVVLWNTSPGAIPQIPTHITGEKLVDSYPQFVCVFTGREWLDALKRDEGHDYLAYTTCTYTSALLADIFNDFI